MAYQKNRRATTEGDRAHNLPNPGQASGLPIDADPECDDINFANYKGIYADDDNSDQKYTCPVTGAHFEFNDICRRLNKVIEKRKPYEETLYGPAPPVKAKVKEEDWGLSVSDELAAAVLQQKSGSKNINVSGFSCALSVRDSSKTSLRSNRRAAS
jgi:hypothetical protein